MTATLCYNDGEYSNLSKYIPKTAEDEPYRLCVSHYGVPGNGTYVVCLSMVNMISSSTSTANSDHQTERYGLSVCFFTA